MPEKKRAKNPKQKVPHPRELNRRMFTYSENQLLDQITKEIMSAWKSDLETMRGYYKEAKKVNDQVKRVCEVSLVEFPKLNKLIEKNKYLSSFPESSQILEELKNSFLELARKTSQMSDSFDRLKLEIANISTSLSQIKWQNELEISRRNRSWISRIFN